MNIEKSEISLNSHSSPPYEIALILKEFEFKDGIYKREAVEAAIHYKNEITPYLLSILEDVILHPQKYAAKDSMYQHEFYASMLLSYFQEPKAHPLFLKVFGLPGELSSDIFNEMVTECLPMFLYQTCDGNIEGIKALVVDRGAYSYCRTSAATALVFCVAKGLAARQNILDFFSNLFTGDEAEANDSFWGLIICSMVELYPDTTMEVIKSTFSRGLIDDGLIDMKFVSKILKTSSVEKELERVRANEMKSYDHENIHSYLKSWGCFRKDGDDNSQHDFSAFDLEDVDDSDLISPEQSMNNSNTVVRIEAKVGRNNKCPCGSGIKFKRCCLK